MFEPQTVNQTAVKLYCGKVATGFNKKKYIISQQIKNSKYRTQFKTSEPKEKRIYLFI